MNGFSIAAAAEMAIRSPLRKRNFTIADLTFSEIIFLVYYPTKRNYRH
ncbi:Hypothetical protein, conserved [Brucella canis ATCC 23365]|uniref:Uncharacterized protein n=1 Tax=Brucella canis (strain ATCC 23365 / NCTC 10854 / RM-666) TaxID=483179 RepID=A9MCN9_BRUC2|nr:Hypothetical protein, conserved [Brucella canis ATCC 23365]AEW16200.1 hypothetical protein BCA52141_II1644 [Brucella canis HSK A52141]